VRALLLLLPLLLPAQQFDVATIKPNTSGSSLVSMRMPAGGTFTATNASLRMMIARAFKLQSFEITGGPSWLTSDRFDVAAKSANPNLTDDQFRLMVQALLADRFQLTTHRETRTVPVYSLVPAKSGLKLPNANPAPCANPALSCGSFGLEATRMEGRGVSMASLTNGLAALLGRPVIDNTGFPGTFDTTLEFAPLDNPSGDSTRPTLFTVIQEKLGLRLESEKGPSEILVIDRVERPSEN
jgi:uncharacterized protein (TIGR03435 family)